MVSSFCYSLVNKLREPVDNFFEKCENVYYRSKDEITTTKGKVMIAAGLGFGMYFYQFNTSLAAKTINALGFPPTRPDPFGDVRVSSLALSSPFACLIGPVIEEIFFRGGVQEDLCNKLERVYKNKGFSDYMSNAASRVTSLFCTSAIFAGVHLLNAPFAENQSTVYAQTIIAASAGLIIGLAKEFSGELSLPIGIHVGNNIAAWANNIHYSMSRA